MLSSDPELRDHGCVVTGNRSILESPHSVPEFASMDVEFVRNKYVIEPLLGEYPVVYDVGGALSTRVSTTLRRGPVRVSQLPIAQLRLENPRLCQLSPMVESALRYGPLFVTDLADRGAQAGSESTLCVREYRFRHPTDVWLFGSGSTSLRSLRDPAKDVNFVVPR